MASLPARIRALMGVGLLVLATSCGADPEAPPTAPPRHLVLISIDTLRADRLGCYGYDRDTSPHLDRLAARSLRFADATAAASNTAPSHMTMFTGLAPPVHGVFNVSFAGGKPQAPTLLSPAMPTLAERLSAEGFDTAAFTDGGYLTPEMQFDRGFRLFHRKPETAAEKVDRALEWLSRQDGEQRTFLFVHTYEVHAPYLPPAEHDVYTDPSYTGPIRDKVDAMRALEGHVGPRMAGDFLPRFGEVGPEDVRYLSDLYDGGVRYTDAELGRLFDALSRPPWAGDTALIVLSDHGEAFGEHDDLDHAGLYASVTRVPFLVQLPGGPVGVRDEPVGGVDVLPTALDLLGLPAPDVCDGRSVLGELPADRPLTAYNDDPAGGGGTSLRVGHDQLVRHWAPMPWTRYDLAADPGQAAPLPTDDDVGRGLRAMAERVEIRQADVARLLGRGQEGAAELSPETLRQLEALGYLGDG